MKLDKWIITLAIILSFGAFTHALTSGQTIDGKVKSFSEKEVEITSGKKTYHVPRKFILLSDLKIDQDISVSLTQEEAKSVKSNVTKGTP